MVDFPAPFGPSEPAADTLVNDDSSPSTALIGPKLLVRLWISIAGTRAVNQTEVSRQKQASPIRGWATAEAARSSASQKG